MREPPTVLATLPSTAIAVKMATLSITPEVAQFIEEAVARGVAEGLAKLSLPASEPQKPSGKAPKEKKARKPRDPDAKPNAWILFTSRVRSVLSESGNKLGVEATQFCSSLKTKNPDLDSWTSEAILTEFSSWEKPEVSKQAAAGKSKGRKGSNASAESAAAAEPKPEKPKKVLSEEHKAAMKAGREKKAAEKKAAASAPTSAPASPEPKASAPAPATAAAANSEWKPIKVKGKLYLWNPSNNYAYYREEDGSQGEWAGILDLVNKVVDTSIPEPLEDDGEDFILDM